MLLALLLAAGIQNSASYQEAVALYRRVELEKALVQLHESLPAAANDVERGQVFAWIGLVEGQLGHLEKARVALTEAIRLDPAVELPAPGPPDVVAILEELRANARRAAAANGSSAPAVSPLAAPGDGGSSLGTAGVVTMVAGGVLVLAGGVIVAVGVDTVYRQAFEAEYQAEALALRDLGYAEYAVGGVVAGVGALALAAGLTMTMLE